VQHLGTGLLANNTLGRYYTLLQTATQYSTLQHTAIHLVEGLFLHPVNFGVGVLFHHVTHHVIGEWANLLHADYDDILHFTLLALVKNIVVHTPGAHDDSLDLIIRYCISEFIWQEPLEILFVKERQIRLARRKAQERLGRDYYERFAEVPPDLAAEKVEVVGRSRR